MLSHCGLNLLLLRVFSCAYLPSIYLPKCPFKSFAHVFFFFLYYWILRGFFKSMFWIQVLNQIYDLQIFDFFKLICSLTFHSVKSDFKKQKSLTLMMFNLCVNIFFYRLCFGIIFKKNSPTPKSKQVSSGSFIGLSFTFWSMIHAELIV